MCFSLLVFFFFFNDTATTEIYTLSLHDALPISPYLRQRARWNLGEVAEHIAQHPLAVRGHDERSPQVAVAERSEEHTSELQSQSNLVCRLLLEKKNMTMLS